MSNCPRCSKANSYTVNFNFKSGGEKLILEARCCKVCGYMWAEEEHHLDIIRRHMLNMAKGNAPEESPKKAKSFTPPVKPQQKWQKKTSTKFKALPRQESSSTRAYNKSHTG